MALARFMSAAMLARGAFVLTTLTSLGCGWPEGSDIDLCKPGPCPYISLESRLVDGTLGWEAGALGSATNVTVSESPCNFVPSFVKWKGSYGFGHGVAIHCALEVKGSVMSLFLENVWDLREFDKVGRTEVRGAALGLGMWLCDNHNGQGCRTTDSPVVDGGCRPQLDDVPVIVDVEEASGKRVALPDIVSDDFHRVVTFQFDTGPRSAICAGPVSATLALRLEASRSDFNYYPDEMCTCR